MLPAMAEIGHMVPDSSGLTSLTCTIWSSMHLASGGAMACFFRGVCTQRMAQGFHKHLHCSDAHRRPCIDGHCMRVKSVKFRGRLRNR